MRKVNIFVETGWVASVAFWAIMMMKKQYMPALLSCSVILILGSLLASQYQKNKF